MYYQYRMQDNSENLLTTGGIMYLPSSLPELLIWIVIAAACIAAGYVGLKQLKIDVPPWAVQLFWIVVVTFCVVFAIRLLIRM